MITKGMATKIAAWANSEVPARNWYTATGSGTGTPGLSDTALFSETQRVAIQSIGSSNETVKVTTLIPGFTAGFSGKNITEFGMFDASSNGNLVTHTNNFTAFTPSPTKQYFIKEYSQITWNYDLGNIITTNLLNNVISYLKGGSVTAPAYVAFSTHLILDTCNVTTGWTNGGQAAAIATNTNYVEGTASLDLTKSGTAGTLSTYTKTITAVNMSNADTFRINLRFNTTTTVNKLTSANAVKIRVGSDSSNYKQYAFARSDFLLGWQTFELLLSAFTTTGSPNMSAITYLYIEFNTNNNSDTITTGEFLMDFWSAKWALAQSDTTLHQEVVRQLATTIARTDTTTTFAGSITTGSGNTYNYYFVGLFDAISSGTLYLVAQSWQLTKDSNTQINYEVGLRVRNIG